MTTRGLYFFVLCFLIQNSFSQEAKKKFILINPDKSFLKKITRICNVTLEGNFIKVISGKEKNILCFKQLNQKTEKSLSEPSLVFEDFPLKVERPASTWVPHKKTFYLAKKDFGLPKFWKLNPKADGRNVIVGVIDDGISPLHQGFQKTTTGERKYLAHFSNSTGLQFKLTGDETPVEGYLPSQKIEKFWTGLIKEERKNIGLLFNDLNRNKKKDEIKTWVFQDIDKKILICIDSNNDGRREKTECFRSFNKTGEFGFWDEQKKVALLAEFDPLNETLTVNEGEDKGDSHGEGVASVMAGHLIAGKFNGVAPGAKILDYDIGEPSPHKKESFYTFSTFLKALDILGKNGAEVVNISYSLYFLSEENQNFMKLALEELIKKYNFVLCFSAGNNGPGLTSLNRRSIYPNNVLVVGAFAGKDLYEKVHGVSGLPDQGRLAYYSSRGPGPSGGSGPSLIAPLASLVYSTADRGLRAFSGTSSASPASAGLVAVLISALKNENLPIKASALVGALKYSGKSLKNTPFIAQGFGLPQIEKSVLLYKKIIEGDLFQDVKTEIVNPLIKTKKGLIFKTSELHESYTEARVYLKGIPSEVTSSQKRSEMFLATRMEYSHPWIDGPQKGFLSTGYSSFSIGLDLEKIDWSEKDEIFGEIKILKEKTGQVLQVIPITIIKDLTIQHQKSWKVSLNAEQGKRLHFHIPPSIKGVKISAQFEGHSTGKFGLKIYNPFGVKGSSFYPKKGLDTIIRTPKPGHYQLGLFRIKGTKRAMRLNIKVTPLKINLTSKGLLLKEGSLYIESQMRDHLKGKIIIKSSPQVIKEKLVEFNGENAFSLEAPFSNLDTGIYQIKLIPLYPKKWIYQRESCFFNLKNEDKLLLSNWGKTFQNILPNKSLKEATKVKIHCRFFDSFKKENFSMPFFMKLKFHKKTPVFEKEVLLRPGQNILKLEKIFLHLKLLISFMKISFWEFYLFIDSQGVFSKKILI